MDFNNRSFFFGGNGEQIATDPVIPKIAASKADFMKLA